MNVVRRQMYAIKSVSTSMGLTTVLVGLAIGLLQMKSLAMVCIDNKTTFFNYLQESNLEFQTLMNAVKRQTDVTKTAITLLVHMPVAVTEAIVLGQMESLASV